MNLQMWTFYEYCTVNTSSKSEGNVFDYRSEWLPFEYNRNNRAVHTPSTKFRRCDSAGHDVRQALQPVVAVLKPRSLPRACSRISVYDPPTSIHTQVIGGCLRLSVCTGRSITHTHRRARWTRTHRRNKNCFTYIVSPSLHSKAAFLLHVNGG